MHKNICILDVNIIFVCLSEYVTVHTHMDSLKSVWKGEKIPQKIENE